VQFTFTLMNEADAQAIMTWHYEEPYAIYNMDSDLEDTAEMLDRRSPHYTVRDEQGELIGFFSFGTSAQPWDTNEPGLYAENKTIDVGLGMRPDLTGKGLGLAFVNAGLAFAREQFAPEHFRLFVLTFNERAIRIYERAGFQRVRMFTQPNIDDEYEFLEMSHKA